ANDPRRAPRLRLPRWERPVRAGPRPLRRGDLAHPAPVLAAGCPHGGPRALRPPRPPLLADQAPRDELRPPGGGRDPRRPVPPEDPVGLGLPAGVRRVHPEVEVRPGAARPVQEAPRPRDEPLFVPY